MTALALGTLETVPAVAALTVTWVAALCGASAKLLRFDRSDRFGSIMYGVTGWSGLLAVPSLWRHGELLVLCLVVAGGLVYSLGAIGFGRRWPTLRPSTFSYHEVWHACTIAAAGLHLAAVWAIATDAPCAHPAPRRGGSRIRRRAGRRRRRRSRRAPRAPTPAVASWRSHSSTALALPSTCG